MKTIAQIKTSAFNNSRSQLAIGSHALLTKVLTGTLLSGSLLLAGCQTTPDNIANATNSNATAAKTILAKALQQQRRQSFSYHSNMQISNEQQFNNSEVTQLVATDDVDSYCVDTHDQAYADLIMQSAAIKKEVSDIAFATQRSAIKQSYIDCNQAYEVWRDQQDYDDGYYDDNYYEEYESDEYGYDESSYSEEDEVIVVEPAQADANVERIGQAGATIVETSRISATGSNSATNNSDDEAALSPYYQQLFDSYDEQTSVLDIKKAKLLDAYLLKPLSINAQGVYQPLAGRFTMLGNAQYQSRNNMSNINQPIYVDLKSGSIYLWADNFAMFNSELLDNKLGVKWQNKWLRLAIDDGTLPKGFGSTLIKAHFNALDQAYEQADVSQFDFITPDSLLTLAPKIPKQQLTPMLESSQIIRRIQSSNSYEQMRTNYLRFFYDNVAKQYPELIDNDIDVETPSAIFTTGSFSSENIVKKVLAIISKIITDDSYKSNIVIEDVSASIKPQELDFTLQELYGFDQRGQLQWQHWRNDQPQATSSVKPQKTIDVLQQYAPIGAQNIAFPNLPKDMQIPDASNSIDLRAYSKELAAYYRAGNGTFMGKMLFNMLSMYNIQTPALDSELDEAEIAIEIAE